MRYLIGFLCVCALGVVPLSGCADVISDGSAGTGGMAGSAGTGGEAGTGAGAAQPTQHAACSVAATLPLPALPAVNADPTGRPSFADWEDVMCDTLTGAICTGDGPCGQFSTNVCIQGVPGGEGICVFGDSDPSCGGGDGEALNYQNFACWICAFPELHAEACCAGLAGFDCRSWPFPADGPPGSVCARHEDCEAGLLCGAHTGSGYGICQCPGGSGDLSPPAGCF